MSGLFLMVVLWTGPVDHVATVEINTFGDQPRTAILYRDADDSVVDWRWYSCPNQIPRALGDGRHVAVWDDQGRPRTVYCNQVRFTRTREDRELADRSLLPEHKRRKLTR